MPWIIWPTPACRPVYALILKNHLVRLARAKDQLTLSLATERAEGYVEGVESARALTPATVEALYVAVDNAATARQLELEL